MTPGLYSIHTSQRGAEVVMCGSNPDFIRIKTPMIPALQKALQRALNTWPDSPPELVELSDILNNTVKS